MESLSGNFLISTPQMPDPRFQEQVIFLCAHNEEGAMGLVINNPNFEITLREVMQGAGFPEPDGDVPFIYMGGPVETDSGFILYSSDYSNSNALEVTPEIFLSRDSKLLADLSCGKGPDKYLFMLGYAGWGAGQLESEIARNGWLTGPATPELVFDAPNEEKWGDALRSIGVDPIGLSATAGRA